MLVRIQKELIDSRVRPLVAQTTDFSQLLNKFTNSDKSIYSNSKINPELVEYILDKFQFQKPYQIARSYASIFNQPNKENVNNVNEKMSELKERLTEFESEFYAKNKMIVRTVMALADLCAMKEMGVPSTKEGKNLIARFQDLSSFYEKYSANKNLLDEDTNKLFSGSPGALSPKERQALVERVDTLRNSVERFMSVELKELSNIAKSQLSEALKVSRNESLAWQNTNLDKSPVQNAPPIEPVSTSPSFRRP